MQKETKIVENNIYYKTSSGLTSGCVWAGHMMHVFFLPIIPAVLSEVGSILKDVVWN